MSIQKKFTPKREREIQKTAELIYSWIQQLPSPADGAAALAMVQCALIWGQGPKDEAAVRKLLGFTVEGTVEMWRAQRAMAEAAKETVQ